MPKLLRSPYLWSGSLGLILSVPGFSFMFVLFSMGVGMVPLILVGIWIVVAPAFAVIDWALHRSRVTRLSHLNVFLQSWICCLMIHLGFAAGYSRWGFASSMGGKNIPYEEAVLWPFEALHSMIPG